MFEERKKIILVHSKDTGKFANYLQLLLSSVDDQSDTIVGVKDGSVETAIWNENVYLDQKPTLSSKEYVIFLGSSKAIQEECFGMQEHFNKYGMKYGWYGNRAWLVVDSTIKRKEYDEFYEYANKYISDIEKTMDSQAKTLDKDKDVGFICAGVGVGAAQTAGAVARVATVAGGIAAANGMAVFLPIAIGIFAPAGAVAGFGGAKLIRHIREKKEVFVQQYTCLILRFYLEGIQQFLS